MLLIVVVPQQQSIVMYMERHVLLHEIYVELPVHGFDLLSSGSNGSFDSVQMLRISIVVSRNGGKSTINTVFFDLCCHEIQGRQIDKVFPFKSDLAKQAGRLRLWWCNVARDNIRSLEHLHLSEISVARATPKHAVIVTVTACAQPVALVASRAAAPPKLVGRLAVASDTRIAALSITGRAGVFDTVIGQLIVAADLALRVMDHLDGCGGSAPLEEAVLLLPSLTEPMRFQLVEWLSMVTIDLTRASLSLVLKLT
ncbi:hypothetical protein K437DRAFT_264682 [Tilletiaria anomala UBC 951]|uniref:Uncharacterized protein n=1 Tax=Tilletiaria anomala (strain ATCC 24038 / CBS 436.72 / UBC 951) TaxID=1037660 RepID=A0A066VB29_TILAU|nr:uncharacterized protein K437DRAFT_264682 [Tilletiaria anomala UBC 951]KDN38937.1 hypothetical protein K437DRAFT_264682 [Tilletiaria anomala UBC 951]